MYYSQINRKFYIFTYKFFVAITNFKFNLSWKDGFFLIVDNNSLYEKNKYDQDVNELATILNFILYNINLYNYKYEYINLINFLTLLIKNHEDPVFGMPNFVPAKTMEWKLFKKIWRYEYPNPDDLKKAFENQPKFQENTRNGWHILANPTGSEILYNKETKQFHFWYEGFGVNMTEEERNKPYYMWGGFMDGLVLEYADGINLFYNYLKAYEIFMDKFNTKKQRQELNPNYQEFKQLFPKLEKIYLELVNKKEIIELPQPILDD